MLVGECSAGFELPALGLVVLTEEEIFGAQRRRLRRPRYQRGAAIAAFTDLAPNDLVVHESHGIARYHGLRTLPSDGRDADFLLLEYADGGRLYLPVERLDLITKYMGAPQGAARLDRLGRVVLAAGEGVGARRAARDGRAAAASSTRRARSPSARPSRATRPGSRSSRRPSASRRRPTSSAPSRRSRPTWGAARPMDRLVAGDVGYGKTEVALRAAFKAVADGRQVAVLVPTTVLAQQHWNTFVGPLRRRSRPGSSCSRASGPRRSRRR